MRQITNALSPTNFVLTNPELLRETLTSNADNLVRGMHMLAEDIQNGGGNLKIRQSDASMFEVGRNLATTPGKVVFQNELMQLIQYAPSTETVLMRPLLIVPPWINKYYVLDLTAEKSFIRWCVDQGLTVFCISWVNPDAHLAQKSFDDYVRQGPLAALDAIKQATGEDKVHAIGYCVGGTLLAVTLAAMAARQDERIVSATLFASQVDFTYAGDLKVFVDEQQVAALEQRMAERGYLESKSMATVFNLLRSNDLLWPYVINNYLRGKAPFPFDLLYWNSDATRLPAANHSFYLRNCYLDNKLAKGKMTIGNTLIDLKSVKVPIYNLATREDHIAPAKSVMVGSKLFGGDVRFVVAGSGHIAGVINPPARQKYQFWTGPKPRNADIEGWLAKAKEHPGSWWPDWLVWLTRQSPTEVPARIPGAGALKAIEDAPGSYVKVRIRRCDLPTSKSSEHLMRRTFTVSELKTKCYALLTQVEQTRRSIVITKDGRPIARLRPHRQNWQDRLEVHRRASRKQRHLFQAHRLREAEHQVHVLHRLTRCALSEIIQRGADDGTAGNPIRGDADEGHVRAAHVAGLRQGAERQHVDERLLRVRL